MQDSAACAENGLGCGAPGSSLHSAGHGHCTPQILAHHRLSPRHNSESATGKALHGSSTERPSPFPPCAVARTACATVSSCSASDSSALPRRATAFSDSLEVTQIVHQAVSCSPSHRENRAAVGWRFQGVCLAGALPVPSDDILPGYAIFSYPCHSRSSDSLPCPPMRTCGTVFVRTRQGRVIESDRDQQNPEQRPHTRTETQSHATLHG